MNCFEVRLDGADFQTENVIILTGRKFWQDFSSYRFAM